MHASRIHRTLAELALGLALVSCREGAEEPDLELIDHIVVDAPRTVLAVNQTMQLTATAFDVDGNELTRVPFAWSTDSPAVTVNATGEVRGQQLGTAVVSAAAGDKSGKVSLTVSATGQ